MSYSPQNPNGQATSASSSPVVIASDQSAVKTDGSAVTQPISGTVTANAGTNLNTSLLALEAGGNLAAIASNTNGVNSTVGTTNTNVQSKGLLVQGSDYGGTPKAQNLKIDSSGNAQVAVTNTPTITVSGTVTTSPPANASVNLNQVGGSSVATAATGIAKVGLTDGSGSAINSTSNALNVSVQNGSMAVTESGTWTVQPGNTANTTPWLVSLNPATSGGWSVSSQTGLTNTAVAIKSSAGQFGGYMFYNPNSSVAYIQIFNVASGSVTLGTTTPTYVIPIPAAAAANVEFANGLAHSTAISGAATTTATGSAAPTTALTGFFVFK